MSIRQSHNLWKNNPQIPLQDADDPAQSEAQLAEVSPASQVPLPHIGPEPRQPLAPAQSTRGWIAASAEVLAFWAQVCAQVSSAPHQLTH